MEIEATVTEDPKIVLDIKRIGNSLDPKEEPKLLRTITLDSLDGRFLSDINKIQVEESLPALAGQLGII